MTAPVEARVSLFCWPGQLGAVAAHVEREYSYGCTIAPAWTGHAVAVFEVRHFDGSRFNLAVDKWGNVRRIPDEASTEDARAIVEEMTQIATTP